MKLEETSKIAKENDYEYYEYVHPHSSFLDPGYSRYVFKRKATDAKNKITVSKEDVNRIWIQTDYCDEKDFKMLQAALKLAATPIDDR